MSPRALRYLWPLPVTCIALVLAGAACLTGGQCQTVDGVLEVSGGVASRLLRQRSAAAMTLGHVVFGRTRECLEISRPHERVHVRQYERWGPLLLPLYWLAGGIARWQGRDFHLDNPFEQEAYNNNSQPPE